MCGAGGVVGGRAICKLSAVVGMILPALQLNYVLSLLWLGVVATGGVSVAAPPDPPVPVSAVVCDTMCAVGCVSVTPSLVLSPPPHPGVRCHPGNSCSGCTLPLPLLLCGADRMYQHVSLECSELLHFVGRPCIEEGHHLQMTRSVYVVAGCRRLRCACVTFEKCARTAALADAFL